MTCQPPTPSLMPYVCFDQQTASISVYLISRIAIIHPGAHQQQPSLFVSCSTPACVLFPHIASLSVSASRHFASLHLQKSFLLAVDFEERLPKFFPLDRPLKLSTRLARDWQCHRSVSMRVSLPQPMFNFHLTGLLSPSSSKQSEVSRRLP
jgi:hypothetical protein